jgi:hypothetical protein
MKAAGLIPAVRLPVQAPLAVAVPNRVEVHPDLTLRAIGHDDPAALFGDAGGDVRFHAAAVGEQVVKVGSHSRYSTSPQA